MRPGWNVNCQAGQNSNAEGRINNAGENAIRYLAPYVSRVAISDNRIVNVSDEAIVIKYKKQKSNRLRTIKFRPMEFIRRFLQHVLPKGFMKIRYFGFMHPACAVGLNKVKEIITDALGISSKLSEHKPEPQPVCPHCGGILIFRYLILPLQDQVLFLSG